MDRDTCGVLILQMFLLISVCGAQNAHVSNCLIERDSDTSLGVPTTDGVPETTYSCVASDNCDYDVHVIGNYESSNGRHGFYTERQAGDTDVELSVSGESSRPLVLVLVSYEPVRWILHVPSGVTIDKVIVGGYHESTVIDAYQRVTEIETLGRELPYGYGTGHTADLLLDLWRRFGPVRSFSGSYRADEWLVNIARSTECNPVDALPPPEECDFYQCDDGSCAILREDCGNQDTEEEESNDGNSGTSSVVTIATLVLSAVFIFLIVLPGLCYRYYKYKKRTEFHSNQTAHNQPPFLSLHHIPHDQEHQSSSTTQPQSSMSELPPSYAKSAELYNAEPPPPYPAADYATCSAPTTHTDN